MRCAHSPDLRLDVTLALHEHVDDRALVDVLAEDVLGDAALEQLAPFVDLVGHHIYERAIVDVLVKSKGHVKSKIW